MAINPERLVDRNVEIIETTYRENHMGMGPMLVITVERMDTHERASLHLMTGYDPDGDPTETLAPGEVPKSIREFYADFGVTSADQLVRVPDRIRLNGIYWDGSNELVGLSKFECLGKLPYHSWCAWGFDPDAQLYKRECTIFGCSDTESAKELQFGGQMKCVDAVGNKVEYQSGCPTHTWGIWQSTAGREGTYLPPFAYKTTCSVCKMTWYAERLYPKYNPADKK